MDITDISSLSSELATGSIQLQASVKCIKAAQETMMAAGDIIADTAEISEEAFAKYFSEL